MTARKTADLTADGAEPPFVAWPVERAPTELSGLLRAAMDAKGWSIRALEAECGIPRATIGVILTGQQLTVPDDTLKPIARALGLPWEQAQRAELASRASVWQLPARAQRLSPAGRRALTAHMDWLLDQEQR